MPANSTYKVDVVYDLKGNAQRGLAGLKQQAQSTAQGFGGLRNIIALVGGGALFAGASKFLIGFNRDIGKMKIGLSTVIATNFHKPFEAAQAASEKLFTSFQKMAIESPATTKDFVEMSNMIAGGVLQAGMGLKQLESITKGAVIASSSLGARPEMLALDVQQMLAGTVGVRDRYARQLLAGVGVTDHKKFNAMKASERASLVEKAFNTPALQDAAKAYSTSFEGVTSTLKDNLELALGKVGLPLFKAITEEVKGWNKWISDNPEKIADIASRLGTGLKSAFVVVKDIAAAIFPILQSTMGVVGDVLAFAANHKDTLIDLTKGLLVFKGLQLGVGMAKGVGGMFGGAFGGIKDAFGQISGALKGESGLLGGITGVTSGFLGLLGPLSLVAGALGGLFSFLTRKTEEQKREEAEKKAQQMTGKGYDDALGKYNSMRERLKNIGVNPDDKSVKLGGLKTEYDELVAGLKQHEKDVIDKGIEVGAVKENLGPGGRELRFDSNKVGGIHDAALRDALIKIFDRRTKEMYDAAGGQWNSLVYGANKRRDGGIMGYFWEDLIEKPAVEDLYGTGGTAKPSEVNVTINKIEVYSDDPDRFVHQAVNSFEEIVRNPTAAREIMRGAF